jgi:hypothetical protein
VDAERGSGVDVSFDRWPESSHHGFDGADAIVGVCAILARPIPAGKLANPIGAEARLAAALMRLAEPKAAGQAPVLSAAALRRNGHPLVWLLSHLPLVMLRWAIRLPLATRLLAERPRLFPVLSVPLSSEPRAVLLREHLHVTLPDQPGVPVEIVAEGSVGLSLEIDSAKLRETQHRYRRVFGNQSSQPMRAGFLLFHERPRAVWTKSFGPLTPRSRCVIEIGDLAAAIPHMVEGPGVNNRYRHPIRCRSTCRSCLTQHVTALH